MLLLLWLITCQNYRDFEDVFAHRLCVKLRDTSVKERKKEKESRRSCTEMFKKKKKLIELQNSYLLRWTSI